MIRIVTNEELRDRLRRAEQEVEALREEVAGLRAEVAACHDRARVLEVELRRGLERRAAALAEIGLADLAFADRLFAK